MISSWLYYVIKELFLGCPTSPNLSMNNGPIPRDAMVWMDKMPEKRFLPKPNLFLLGKFKGN